MKLIEQRCPYCGAPVTVRDGEKSARCEYCRSIFTIELERQTPQPNPISHPTPRPVKPPKRAPTRGAVALIAIILCMLLPIILIYSVIRVNENWTDNGIREDTYRNTPESAAMQAFVTAAFGKELAAVTAEEYNALQYLKIDLQDHDEEIWVFTYANDVTEDGAPLEPGTINLDGSLKLEAEDVQCFTNLVTLDFSHSAGITWASQSGQDLRCLQNLRNLTLSQADNLSKMRFAQPNQIRSISASSVWGDGDIQPLKECPHLEAFYAQYVGEQVDLTQYPELVGLKALGLNLRGDATRDISFLSAMTNLTELHIGGAVDPGLTVLYGMPQLETLEIAQIPKLKTVAFVRNMPKLTTLCIDGSELLNLDDLEGLTNLISLHLTDNGSLVDAGALTSLTSLQDLSWYNYWITHTAALSPLTGLTQLKSVSISSQYLDAVGGMSTIETLSIYGTDTYSLLSLRGMNSLQDLTLYDDVNVKDPDALLDLPNLHRLTAEDRTLYAVDSTTIFLLQGVSELDLNCTGESSYIRYDQTRVRDNYAVKKLRIDATQVYRLDKEDRFQAVSFGSCANELLVHCPAVEELSLVGNELRDLDFVSAMPNLRVLDIRDNYITDVSALAQLSHFEVLICGDNPITNLAVLPEGVQVR